MQASIQSIEVDKQSINPTLSITANVSYYYLMEAPLSLSGNLRTEDGKTIAPLHETQLNSESTFGLKLFDKLNRDKRYNSGEQYKRTQQVKFLAPLSKEAILYIETRREKNKEQQVTFHFQFVYKYAAIPASPDTFTNQQSHDLSFKIEVNNLYTVYTIKQSDWVRHYSPHLGIGNFMLLELRLPENATVSDPWKELFERLLARLKEMEEAMRHCDWQKVMIRGRQFYENLKVSDKNQNERDWKKFLKDLLEKDGHSSEGINAFFSGVQGLFTFASKYIHDKDLQGQLNIEPTATKEDAELLYGLGVYLLNALGKKISRNES